MGSRIVRTLGLLCLVGAAACGDERTPGALAPSVASNCPEGQSVCGPECADLRSDDHHCGSCGTQCTELEACAAGVCFPRDCAATDCAPDSICYTDACVARDCVGVACGEGQRCVAGECVCAAGFSDCGGRCLDLRFDAASCGACGQACPTGEACALGHCYPADCATADCDPTSVCFQGACVERSCVGVSCPDGEQCDPATGACASCGSLETDQNCGACGRACPAGEGCAKQRCYPLDCSSADCNPDSVCFNEACVARACVGVSCPSGQACDAATGACTSCGALDTDLNCGECGRACPAGEGCAKGRCYPLDCAASDCNPDSICFSAECVARTCVGVSCPSTQACDPATGQCTSCGALDTDQNCGACGQACAAGERCAGGRCYPADCAAMTCEPGSVCFNGTCEAKTCLSVACPADQACDPSTGSCVSCGPLTTDQNCGACGAACPAGQSCANGRCYASDCPSASCDPDSICFSGSCKARKCVGVSCPQDQACERTSGQCVPCGALTTDANCGACGSACPADQRCGDGACYPKSCSTASCAANAVCVDGGCLEIACLGKACGTNEVCSAGACVCADGSEKCGGAASCQSLASDPENCGACGRACAADEACVGGQCVCAGALTMCGTSCRDLQQDAANCGACNRVCPNRGEVCAGGTCRCPGAQLLCGGACVDPQKDNLNCGRCGTVCPSAQSCVNGVCTAPFTCQANYNLAAVADCGVFPLDPARCGADANRRTLFEINEQVPVGSIERTLVIGPEDRIEVTGQVTSTYYAGSNWNLSLVNDAGVVLDYVNSTAGNTSPTPVTFTGYGSNESCAHPTRVRLTIAYAAVNAALKVEAVTRVGSNTGQAAAPGALDLLAGSSDRVCDQVCGNALAYTSCVDAEWFEVEIPAQRALAFDWVASNAPSRYGSVFDVVAFDALGVQICTVSSEIVGTTSRGTGRLRNNTLLPQKVRLRIKAEGTSLGMRDFDVAIATEQ